MEKETREKGVREGDGVLHHLETAAVEERRRLREGAGPAWLSTA